jgi:hypothetical protein
MSCDKYKKYELGKMNKNDFLLHLESCPECSNFYQEDELLLQAAKDMNEKVKVPDLWQGISGILEKEPVSNVFKPLLYISKYKYVFLRIAAVLLIVIFAGYYILSQQEAVPVLQARILDQAALQAVIEKEQEYLKAIEQLEKTVSSRLAIIDENLINLYQNKIRVINQQITYCKEALERNPANNHIRRYLFAVLQDKKQTLEEILTYPI